MRRLLVAVLAVLAASCPATRGAKGNVGTRSSERTAPDLAVHALDVGQGDAVLLLVGAGAERKSVLIDAGPPDAAAALLAALRRHGVAALDLLVISHAHLDHIGGLPALLDALPVRAVLDSGIPHTTATYRRVLRKLLALKEQGRTTFTVARRGATVPLGPRTRLTVLAPEEPLLAGTRSDLNANSVVVRVTHGRVALLFLGDAERETEERLLASRAELRADVLKVAHHGSRHASAAALLARIAPRVALVSCGRANDYGHPHRETLRRLMDAHVQVLRTDLVGEISLFSDGEAVRVGAR